MAHLFWCTKQTRLAVLLISLLCVVGCSIRKAETSETSEPAFYAVSLREVPSLRSRMPRIEPLTSAGGTKVSLGPLVIELPSRLHTVGQVQEGTIEGGAYEWWAVVVRDDAAPQQKLRLSWATDNAYLEDFENTPRVNYYIKDIRAFAAPFTSDLELFRTVFNTIPNDLEGQPSSVQKKMRGMLMMKTVGPLQPVEVDGLHVTLIRPADNNRNSGRVLAAKIFDSAGRLRGTVIVSPDPLTLSPETTRVFDDVFSRAVFTGTQRTTRP